MGDFNELLGNSAEQMPAEIQDQLNQEVINSFSFYVNEEGEHKALISGLRLHYKNDDKKKCLKDDPGAKLSGASLRLIVVKDPSKQLLGKDLLINGEEDLGRLTFNQYISLKEEDQWKHVRTFADFTINNMPEAGIVQEAGKKVAINNIPLFVGIPVIFQIVAGKKEDSRYAENFMLQDHTTLTKELVTKRQDMIEAIEAQLSIRQEAEKVKRDAEKAERKANSGAEAVEQTHEDQTLSDELEGLT
jgi:hypothetical protein